MIPIDCDTCDGTGQLEPDDVADVYRLGGECGDCDGTGELIDALDVIEPGHLRVHRGAHMKGAP